METIACLCALLGFGAAEGGGARLIVRGDDMGSTHAANVACVDAYENGIMRTVEVMVPCPWFPEAVELLEKRPGLDVGIHITLTSEWERFKWRPLTRCPSIVDEDGYFFPQIWPGDRFPPHLALKAQNWKVEEIEAEIRAQIELARRKIPRASHVTCHMGCNGWDPKVRAVFDKLAAEYGLEIGTGARAVRRLPLGSKAETLEERTADFVKALGALEPGQTYLYVEHPALDTPEMRAIGHIGYYGVANDRALVTAVFTSAAVKKAVAENGVSLISYRGILPSDPRAERNSEVSRHFDLPLIVRREFDVPP